VIAPPDAKKNLPGLLPMFQAHEGGPLKKEGRLGGMSFVALNLPEGCQGGRILARMKGPGCLDKGRFLKPGAGYRCGKEKKGEDREGREGDAGSPVLCVRIFYRALFSRQRDIEGRE